jgi:1,4-dihydroxy-2-naphthoate octaprenyltransferase
VSAAPVVVGSAAAFQVADDLIWWRAVAALFVAVALQVGVNFANDYSDGVRGTDTERRGPVRLTASGLASPAAVKRAAGLAFATAAVVGLVLALAVDPWLLLIGVAAIAAAVLYTGGPKPYGYLGLGELMVLVFFGFVATAGSAYVQIERVPATAWWGALVVGLPTVGVLLTNNIRDIPTDAVVGKRTLAVRLGSRRARKLYAFCIAFAFLALVPMCIDAPWAAIAFLAAPLALQPLRLVLSRDDPLSLVAALVGTVRLTIALAILTAIGLAVS